MDSALNLTMVKQRNERFLFHQLKMVKRLSLSLFLHLFFRFSGSPADKAGLCVDDEVIAMNDENIEHMTFEQVRKILKERNLRGSIKMKVKTYEGKERSFFLILFFDHHSRYCC